MVNPSRLRLPPKILVGLRLKQAVNLLLGREVVIDAVSLDREKVDRLIAFLITSVAVASGEDLTYSSSRPTLTAEVRP